MRCGAWHQPRTERSWPGSDFRGDVPEVLGGFVPLALVAGEVDLAVAADQVAAPRPRPYAHASEHLLQVHERVGVDGGGVERLEGARVAPVGVGDRPVELPTWAGRPPSSSPASRPSPLADRGLVRTNGLARFAGCRFRAVRFASGSPFRRVRGRNSFGLVTDPPGNQRERGPLRSG